MFITRSTSVILLTISASLLPSCSRQTAEPVASPAPRQPAARAGTVSTPAAEPMSPQAILDHVAVLASDEFEGRGTGQRGIDRAADYIAEQFAESGVQPGGPDGTYFQEFAIHRGAKLGEQTTLTFSGVDDQPRQLHDFIPLSFSTEGTFTGEVVFVGYGITNPDQQHDDYEGVDVTGKVALLLRREPAGWNGERYTRHASFESKVNVARDHGAAAVLIVNQAPADDDEDMLMPFRAVRETYGLPAIQITRSFADSLLEAGSLNDLRSLQEKLDGGEGSVSVALAGVQASGEVAYERQSITARNVLGLLPGTGPRADEFIVVGAHYDHLGVRDDEIYNGADDNASGTAGVIELARSLAAEPVRERSLLFMLFSGEEMGLLGSRHYVEEPTVSIDSIVAMLNMDMIGRLDRDDEMNMLAIHGLGTGDRFERIVEARAREHQLNYLPDASALGPSDHQSFYLAGVPSLFFFTGVHGDYHQSTDDTMLVNHYGTSDIVRLVRDITFDLVQGAEEIEYVEVNRPANIFRGSDPRSQGRSRVVMGINPSRSDSGPGWLIESVVPGSGAAQGGMLDGDRIIAIDEASIDGFGAYRQAVADKEPGDVVSVTVLRDGAEKSISVKLSGRGNAGMSTATLADRFQAHIEFLASDELTGRGVGTPGIEKAAEYIAAQFREIGLAPAGENGTYYQTLEVAEKRKLTDEVKLNVSRETENLKLGKDFLPLPFSSEGSFDGAVAFCGYGIVTPDGEHDDFVHVDVQGKVALIVTEEPSSMTRENDGPTLHALLRNKVYNVKDRGASAVLVVNRIAEGEEDALPDPEDGTVLDFGIPAMQVSRDVANAMLSAAEQPSLSALQKKMDEGAYVSRDLEGMHASGVAGFERSRTKTRNVMAMVRGEGPLADEVVVVGAHYDHLGIAKPMMRTFKDGKLVKSSGEREIHNGADDNASGVAGLIEIGRMLAEGESPRRSILLVAFTAEESGLHGSNHYIDSPVVPLDHTVAMLNMDMIGRMVEGEDSLEIFGVKTGDGFERLVESAATDLGLDVKPTPAAGGRSDHAPFVRRAVPSMHFFTGQHSDYHKPSDDSDKINAAGGAKVTRLVYEVATGIANRADRIAFHEVKEPSAPADGGTPTFSVVMGLAPSYGDDGKPGMPVASVNADGPAELAGMKAGDRIISIGGKKVSNIYDYMAATRGNKPGDVVDVIVLRDDGEVTLKVSLAAAR